ncbi:30S ribosomal protein S17 [Desulfonema magnum]|uniref:Small ribosomal subunit protein uS17 n=1 Tax=Desulfonema magnum TaxID=45655 RepID=A0A975GM16_9BACT|nr:30S ribosomal protein S17 [Desulfonema magnum]QTA85378.1 30S ribosomal protein S17 [Desulfonema magnum]
MERRGMRRQVVGRVVSNKMDKTVIVQVERLVKHNFYHKYVRRRTKFAAHDENNICQIGDKVSITESRPMSKTKRWRVNKVVVKAV